MEWPIGSGKRVVISPEVRAVMEREGGLFNEAGELQNIQEIRPKLQELKVGGDDLPRLESGVSEGVLYREWKYHDRRAQELYEGYRKKLSPEAQQKLLLPGNTPLRVGRIEALAGKLTDEARQIPSEQLKAFVDELVKPMPAEQRGHRALTGRLLEKGGLFHGPFKGFMGVQAKAMREVLDPELIKALETKTMDTPVLKGWLKRHGHVGPDQIDKLTDLEVWDISMAIMADETSVIVEAVNAVLKGTVRDGKYVKGTVRSLLEPHWPRREWHGIGTAADIPEGSDVPDAATRPNILMAFALNRAKSIEGGTPVMGNVVEKLAQGPGIPSKPNPNFMTEFEAIPSKQAKAFGKSPRSRDHGKVLRALAPGMPFDRVAIHKDRSIPMIYSLIELRLAFLGALSALVLGQQINDQEEELRNARFG
jgi:hypothetical protein